MLLMRITIYGEVVELVYGTSLENWRACERTVGSNPTLSAKTKNVEKLPQTIFYVFFIKNVGVPKW